MIFSLSERRVSPYEKALQKRLQREFDEFIGPKLGNSPFLLPNLPDFRGLRDGDENEIWSMAL